MTLLQDWRKDNTPDIKFIEAEEAQRDREELERRKREIEDE